MMMIKLVNWKFGSLFRFRFDWSCPNFLFFSEKLLTATIRYIYIYILVDCVDGGRVFSYKLLSISSHSS